MPRIMKNYVLSPEEEEEELCPRCRGRCYEDDFEDEECRTCLGEGMIPVL